MPPTLAPWRPVPGPPAPGPRCRALAADTIPERRRYRLKNKLLGPPLVTEQLSSERLGRPTALGVLAPDCISSSAYGTEEMLTQLVPDHRAGRLHPGGPDHPGHPGRPLLRDPLVPRGHPALHQGRRRLRGGPGQLRPKVAQIAAVALLIDYTVTVAVQTSAGTAALTSAVPGLANTFDTVGHHRRGRAAPALRQPARHPRGREVLRLPHLLLRGRAWAPSSSPATSRRRWATCTTARSRPSDALRRAGRARRARACLMGLAFITLLRVLRQRRLVADRARGHLQRGGQLPAARVGRTPARPWSS